jgi:hypothetical protein
MIVGTNNFFVIDIDLNHMRITAKIEEKCADITQDWSDGVFKIFWEIESKIIKGSPS